MPIKVSCQCGKDLNVPDKFAGKAVKCPSCGQAVKVPAVAGDAAPAAPAAPVGPSASERMDDLFNEEGFTNTVEAICPVCRAEMPASAVFCTKCGYNKESGEQLEAHKTAGVDIDHGTLALQKAEGDMVKDAEMQRKMVAGSGMPWWGLALVLFVIGSALTIAVLTVNASRREDDSGFQKPLELFMVLAGSAFAMVGLGAYAMIVAHGFRKEGGKGLLTLIPPYAIYYVFCNTKETWRYLLVVAVAGGIGGTLIGMALSRGF